MKAAHKANNNITSNDLGDDEMGQSHADGHQARRLMIAVQRETLRGATNDDEETTARIICELKRTFRTICMLFPLLWWF